MGFSTFGITHLIWLVSLGLIGVVWVLLYRRLNYHRRNIMRTALGILIVSLEIVKDIVAVIMAILMQGSYHFIYAELTYY